MKSSSLGTVSGSFAAALLLSVAANAAPANGCYGAYYTSLEVLPISEGHTFLTYNAFGTGYATDDRSSPLHGMAGPCVGYQEINGESVTGAGRCVRTDQDGDQIRIVAQIKSAAKGTWELKGLSGKWVGATGGGTWWDEGSGNEHYYICFDGSFDMAQ